MVSACSNVCLVALTPDDRLYHLVFKQRGKFRPRLTELVQANSEEDVKSASIKAFKALPDIPAAIQALTVLKAVGPATASGKQ